MTTRRYLPEELLAKYRAVRNAVSAEAFFSSPTHKKTQELWCAAHFSRAYSQNIEQCAVWVADRDIQTDVDFELQVGGVRHPFQITEVQTPGRRRGEEYKGTGSDSWKDEDWSEGTEHGARWIHDAIEKKLTRYGGNVGGLNLLVYINFPAWEQQYETIRQGSSVSASKFASVWLLNGNALCCISPSSALGFLAGWMVIPESLAHDEP